MTINLRLRPLAWAITAFALAAVRPLPMLAEQCHFCKKNCQPCELCPVTIHCPTPVVETHMKSCVVEEIKEREETYTVFKRVPVTEKFTKKTCYLSDEIISKEITETQCKRVDNPVARKYSIDVPAQEIHEGTRTRMVCDQCGQVCCVEEPCQCMLTRIIKETATEDCSRPDVVFEKTKRTIDYCKKVPKIKEEFCAEEVIQKLVPVEKTRKVQVCVPKIEKYPVDVKVTRMLPYEVPCCVACAQERARQEALAEREPKLKVLDHEHEHKLQEKLQKIAQHEPEHKLQQKIQAKKEKHQQHLQKGLLNKVLAKKPASSNCDCDECRQ